MLLIKKYWLILYVFVIVAGLIGYGTYIVSATSVTKTKNTIQQNQQKTLSISGNIDALEHVILRFQTSGKLGWVGVKKGDYIRKYQTVAILDQRELQVSLKKYLLAYENQRHTFEQTQDDNKTDLIALSVDLRHQAERLMKESQNDLDSSVLDVELKNLALEYANLYSPIDGLVVRIDSPYAGLNITPAQAEFEIINPHTVYFSAAADQKDVIKLATEMIADITLDAFPDKTITGKITSIAFTPIKGKSGTAYEVKIAMNIDNSLYLYKYGMTGKAKITIPPKEMTLSL